MRRKRVCRRALHTRANLSAGSTPPGDCGKERRRGHLRPFMPQKIRVGNDRSQSTTDVARRRNRTEKLYKAGARRSVTLAAQNADRRAAVSEIELALSTLSSRSAFAEAAIQLCGSP